MTTKSKFVTMRETIESEIERTEIHEKVIEILKSVADKPVTTRIEAKVTTALVAAFGEAEYDVRLYRSYGMTHLEWGGYSRSGGNRGCSLLLSHSDKTGPIAQRYLDDMDSSLRARHERNATRSRLLDSGLPEQIDTIAAQLRNLGAAYDKIHDGDEGRWAVLPSRDRLFEETLNPKT